MLNQAFPELLLAVMVIFTVWPFAGVKLFSQ
jgi:hypothetical protein